MIRCLALTSGFLTTIIALPAQTWTEVGDAGDLPGTAQVAGGVGPLTQIDGQINGLGIPGGAGNDRDMYLIQIDDPLTFSAITSGPAFNLQLFLFDSAGFGIAHNDNNPLVFFDLNGSLTGTFVPGAGQFYLTVSRFDRDPTSGGSEIWADLPLNTERAPDGPGAAGAIDGWNGNNINSGTGSYSIFLTGASLVEPPADLWTEVDDAGDLPGTAQVPSGSGPLSKIAGTFNDPSIPGGPGNDRDMYLIQIDDPLAFTAITAAPAFNTQLFLFDTDGFGVTHNDNNPLVFFDLNGSLTGGFVPGPGLYYLAVSRFDRDPTSGGSEIWADLPLNTERAPDGPGAAGAVDGWNGNLTTVGTGPYTICLTGASYVSPSCSDLTITGGAPGTKLIFELTGAAPEALAFVVIGDKEGDYKQTFGPLGTLELGIAPPFNLLPLGFTDPNGDAGRVVGIPLGFPVSKKLFGQAFTFRLVLPPPSVMFEFCTSDVEAFAIGSF